MNIIKDAILHDFKNDNYLEIIFDEIFSKQVDSYFKGLKLKHVSRFKY